MKPFHHAKISVKRHGGCIEDYIEIHDFFDSSKQCLPDIRHRALLHSAFGIFLVEKVFGTYITNSDGKQIPVRELGEEHVRDDIGGYIPTVEWWFKNMPIEDRMMGSSGERKLNSIKSFKWSD